MKKNIKFYSILLISILIMISISLYTASTKNIFYTEGYGQDATGDLEVEDDNTEYIQKFVAAADNLEKVELYFNELTANTGGKVLIGIKDEQGNIINEEEISKNYIRLNSKYEFKFQKQRDSKGKKYYLYFKFYDLENDSKYMTLKCTDNNQFETSELYKNNELLIGKSLIYKDLYRSDIRELMFGIILGAMVIAIIGCSIFVYRQSNAKVENIFLAISVITYTFFLIAMPTFKNHDEYYHWLRAYEVSQGNLVTPLKGGVQGSYMPGGISEICTSNWINIKYSTMKETAKVELDYSNKGILNSETAAVYSFVQYIPQSAGIIIGRLATNKVLIITYFGRICNMIVSIFILYMAIKIAPFGKKIFFVAAMLPIAIEGFTSLSPDALTISISYLFISYILHISFNENIEIVKGKHKFILLVLSIIIALCKIVYIPLVGLILIIPKEKFKYNRKKITFFLIAAIAVSINLYWLYFSSRYLSNFRDGDSKIQVLLAIKNPIQYIQNILYTIDSNMDKYTMSLYGCELGWGELIKVNYLVPYIFIFMHAVSAISDEKLKDKFKRYQIVYMFLVSITIIGLILTSLYVQWTMIGSSSIAGVQGRYFIPILPIILLIIGSKMKIKSLYEEKSVDKKIYIYAMCIQLYVVAQIMISNL